MSLKTSRSFTSVLLLCIFTIFQYTRVTLASQRQQSNLVYFRDDYPMQGQQPWQQNVQQQQQLERGPYQQQQQRPHNYQNNQMPSNGGSTVSEGTNRQTRPMNQRKLQQQPQNVRRAGNLIEANLHKCRIWVPSDVLDKYPMSTKIQENQAGRLHQIEVCCPGYAALLTKWGTQCHPTCDNCRNGHCYEPNKCQCYEGFVANDNGDCVFTCPLGCLNGKCYLDGSCQCDPGYKLDETRQFCRPICSNYCNAYLRQNCTEPEVCGCAQGYQLHERGCQAVCDPDCGIGGKCNNNRECQCEQGYNLKNGVCQSSCYQKCTNGICYESNRCICNPGFIYHEHSTRCVPV